MYPNPNMAYQGQEPINDMQLQRQGFNQGPMGQMPGQSGMFPMPDRFNQLERRVSRLERQMERLESRVRRLERGFPVPLSSGREYTSENNRYMM